MVIKDLKKSSLISQDNLLNDLFHFWCITWERMTLNTGLSDIIVEILLEDSLVRFISRDPRSKVLPLVVTFNEARKIFEIPLNNYQDTRLVEFFDFYSQYQTAFDLLTEVLRYFENVLDNGKLTSLAFDFTAFPILNERLSVILSELSLHDILSTLLPESDDYSIEFTSSGHDLILRNISVGISIRYPTQLSHDSFIINWKVHGNYGQISMDKPNYGIHSENHIED